MTSDQRRQERIVPGAYEAIAAEHERDHSDGPNEPRQDCPGCLMLAEIRSWRAQVARLTEENATRRDALVQARRLQDALLNRILSPIDKHTAKGDLARETIKLLDAALAPPPPARVEPQP